MIKDIQPHKLAKTFNAWVNKISISGMTSMVMKHYLQPSLSKQPTAIIIHCGINDLMQSTPLRNVHQETKAIIDDIKGKLPNCAIYLSSVIHQLKNNNLNTSVDQHDNTFKNVCNETNVYFLDNGNISIDYLNNSTGAAGPAISAMSLIAIFFQRLYNVFVHIHLAVLWDLYN